MRKIIFRCKIRGKNDYVYWNVFGILCDEDGQPLQYGNHISQLSNSIIFETVEEFTGLTDKNHKNIFEGDVILVPWGGEDNLVKFVVTFVDGVFIARPLENHQRCWEILLDRCFNSVTVVSNIHDNENPCENCTTRECGLIDGQECNRSDLYENKRNADWMAFT